MRVSRSPYEEGPYDVIDRSRLVSHNTEFPTLELINRGLRTMGDRSESATMRGSTKHEAVDLPNLPPQSESQQSFRRSSPTYRGLPRPVFDVVKIQSDTEPRDRQPLLASIPKTNPAVPQLSLPSFGESFGHLAKSVAPLGASSREPEPSYLDPTRSMPRLNQPYTPGGESPSKKLKRRFSEDEILPPMVRNHSVPMHPVRESQNANTKQSSWDQRPNSAGYGGSQQSSTLSSPRRDYGPFPSMQAPAYPERDNSRNFDSSGHYTHEGGRPGFQTYPQHTGPYAPPSSGEPYHPELPRQSYSMSGASYGGAYQPPPQQHYTYTHPHGTSYHAQDRTPFTPGPYQSSSYINGYTHNNASIHDHRGHKPNKKRRGNLPKETTEVLRHWFLANLDHPYPSEEEKNKFMSKTGLLLNQISNWFINARRRQLPIELKLREEHRRRMAAQNGETQQTSDQASDSGPNNRGPSGQEARELSYSSYDDDGYDMLQDAESPREALASAIQQGRRSDLDQLPRETIHPNQSAVHAPVPGTFESSHSSARSSRIPSPVLRRNDMNVERTSAYEFGSGKDIPRR